MLIQDSDEDPIQLQKNQFLQHNFFELPFLNQYQCKDCTQLFTLKTDEDFQEMQNHVEVYHQRKFNEHHQTSTAKIAYFYQRMRSAKYPPRYLYKYCNERYLKLKLIKDEWLDRLTIDCYPIHVIVSNLMNKLAVKSESEKFFKQSQGKADYFYKQLPEIRKFLQLLPLDLLPGEVAWILHDTFKITLEIAKFTVQKYHYPYSQQNQLLRYLQRKGVVYRKFKTRDAQSLTVFATQTMRSNYLEFGDSVSLSFHMVPLKRDRIGRHYNCILFTGQDRNLQPVIFSIGLANGQSFIHYKMAIQFFLQIMDFLEPQTFLTNSYAIMQEALEQLKKQFGFKFNFRSHWKHVKQILRLDFDSTAGINLAMNLFTQAMSSYSIEEFKNIMSFLRKGNLLETQKVDAFQEKGYRYCMSKGRPTFLGFLHEESFLRNLSKDVYKAFEPFQKYKGQFYSLALRFERTLEKNRSEAYNFIDPHQTQKFRVFIGPELQYLSGVVYAEVFKWLLSNYQRSTFGVSVIEKHDLYYVVLDKSLKNGRTAPTKIKVTYNVQQNLWRCQCYELYLTGLPCPHLITVINRTNGCIIYYIHSRWLTKFDFTDLPARQQFDKDQIQSISEIQRDFIKDDQECFEMFTKIKKEEEGPIIVKSQDESDSSIGIIKVEKQPRKKEKYIILDQVDCEN